MLESKCHRCGARAERGPSRRTICARCAVSGGERSSVPDLEELTRGAGSPSEERISLELIAVVNPELASPITSSHTKRTSRWSLVAGALLLGALLGVSGTSAVQHAIAGDAKPGVRLILHGKMKAAHRAPSADLVNEPSLGDEPAPESVQEPVVSEGSAPPLEEVAFEVPPRARHRPRSRSSPSATAAPRPSPVSTPTVSSLGLAPPAQTLPATPTRARVRAAFSSVHDGVQACGDIGLIGTTVVARVVFAGESGRVRHAQVVDANVPPEVRSCVARVARQARVAPFANEELSVTYPFRL